MDNITQGYANLHAAIIEQAVVDYKWALKVLEKPIDDIRAKYRHNEAQKLKKDCEKFFVSRWGQTLTRNNGQLIMERCRREVEQEKESELNG